MLCVKYFVDISQIQQSTTKRMLYHELKEKLRRGDICLQEGDVARVGALMCCLEKLSGEVRAGRNVVYTRFFPEHVMSVNLSWDITQQLKQLEGKSESEIMDLCLQLLSQASGYGMCHFVAQTQSGRDAMLTLRNTTITLSDRESPELVHSMMAVWDVLEVAYRGRRLVVTSKDQDTKGAHLSMFAKLCNRKLAREVFRIITEYHVYLYQRRVPEGILFHRYKPRWIRQDRDGYLLFDLIRTLEESYSFHWTRLHRVDEGGQGQLEDSVLSCQDSTCSTRELLNDSNLDVTFNGLDMSKIGGEKKIKQDYCKICFANRVKTVFCPCGHSVSCISCAKRITTCPICRKSIAHKQTIFTA
eukprot:TRINITY_DN540_c0_g1_i2.p1 TRINITY_DN540_c0_g1~~TRINITY_DN540_c0_g1_i2.p1  ORF type:complete len:358 (-),score=77.82 TRINITY_DN540_c0_g1_i2:763-1836(-)